VNFKKTAFNFNIKTGIFEFLFRSVLLIQQARKKIKKIHVHFIHAWSFIHGTHLISHKVLSRINNINNEPFQPTQQRRYDRIVGVLTTIVPD